MKIFWGFFLCLLWFPQIAAAIPPPDLIVSAWQGILQFLGIGAAFLLTAFWTTKDFIRARFSKKQIILLAVAVLFAFVAGAALLFQPKPLPPKPTTGEFISIDEVIAAEPRDYYRNWKQELLVELSTNINNHRSKKGLPLIEFQTLRSFDAKDLYELLQKSPEDYLILDPREQYERLSFKLEPSLNWRYGDIAQDILPILPKDKTIIVLCYSGIRGYITANIVKQAGYDNVAFIRGGLYNWKGYDLPFIGDDQIDFLQDAYTPLPKEEILDAPNPQIDFTWEGKLKSEFPKSEPFYVELATTEMIDQKIQSFLQKPPLILLCQTDSECFDAVNFSYLFEQAGGQIAGYYQKES